MRHIFTTLALSLCMTFLWCTPTFAQAAHFGVNPTIIETDTPIERLVTKDILIYNSDTKRLTLKVIPSEFVGETQENITPDRRSLYDASSWITLNEDDRLITLEPKAIKRIQLLIRAPNGSVPGGHYGTILLEPVDVTRPLNQSVGITTRIAVLLFLKVPGVQTQILTAPAIGSTDIYEHSVRQIPFIVQNIGNAHLKPSLKVEITNSQGVIIHSFTPSLGLLLPGVLKSVQTPLKTPLSWGTYTVYVKNIQHDKPQVLGTRTIRVYPIRTTSIAFVGALLVSLVYLAVRQRVYTTVSDVISALLTARRGGPSSLQHTQEPISLSAPTPVRPKILKTRSSRVSSRKSKTRTKRARQLKSS